MAFSVIHFGTSFILLERERHLKVLEDKSAFIDFFSKTIFRWFKCFFVSEMNRCFCWWGYSQKLIQTGRVELGSYYNLEGPHCTEIENGHSGMLHIGGVMIILSVYIGNAIPRVCRSDIIRLESQFSFLFRHLF